MQLLFALLLAACAVTAQQTAFDLDGLVVQAEDALPGFQSELESIKGSSSQAVVSGQAAVLAAVSDATTQSLSPVMDRMAALEALAADFQRQATVDTPVLIAKIVASASQRIASEANNRQSVSSTLTAVYSNILANAGAGFASASTSRASIWTQMSNSRSSIVAATSASLSVSIASEDARAMTEAAALSTQIARTTSTSAVAQTSAFVAEASRADAFCATTLASVGTGIPTDTTGLLDWQNCTSAQTSNLYYSSVNGAVFFCDGFVFQSFQLGSFFDSTILSRVQQISMTRLTGPRWVNCFRGSRDGMVGFTFRALCANRGPTLIIARANGYSQIFGGYADVAWGNRPGNYAWSTRAWVYRFNPSNTAQIQQAVLTSGNQNAFYDSPSYGPTWGGGHDLYFAGSNLSGSNSPSTYQAGYATVVAPSGSGSGSACGSTSSNPPLMSYGSGSLPGVTSFSVNVFEAYYMY